MKTITEHFDRALGCWAGSPMATCPCGRVHRAFDSREIEREELLKFEDNRVKNPDRFIVGDGDAIGIAVINGIPHVWNCPCESLARMEEFIWSNREVITRYLRQRLDAEAKTATEQAERLRV